MIQRSSAMPELSFEATAEMPLTIVRSPLNTPIPGLLPTSVPFYFHFEKWPYIRRHS
jgi:hypothetical protein